MTFVVDSYSEANKSAGGSGNYIFADIFPSTAHYCAGGQTFEVVNSCKITSAKFYMFGDAGITGFLTFKIYKHAGTFGTTGLPTGSAIAVSEAKDISTLAGAFQLEELYFTPSVYLTAGYYCIAVVIDSGNLHTAGLHVHIGKDGTAPTHSGNGIVYVNGWSADAASDVCFYVYGEYINGKFNETKKALIAEVEAAIPEATVEGNWREGIGEIVRHLPFITVRMKDVLADVYDRNIGDTSGDGCIAHYPFSLFIFHSNCLESGEEKGKYAQDVADRIMSYIAPQPSSIGYDIGEMSMRESEPERGAHRISRVIVEGSIHVKRID